MAKWTRARLVAALALGALALASAAHADELIIDPGRTVRATGSVTFRSEAFTTTCNVTLEGSFKYTSFERTAGTQIGDVSRSTFSGCTRGTATSLGLPWRVNYSSITGGYPEEATAMGAEIVSSQIQLTPEGLTCLYRGNLGLSFELTADETYEEAWDMQRATVSAEGLSLVSGALCPRTATASGSVTLSAAQQVRRRIGRLDIETTAMAARVTTQPFRMANYSPRGEPDLRVERLSIIRLVRTDTPERFAFGATNECPGRTLRADFANTCRSDVVFTGLEAERPKIATLQIDWNNSREARTNYAIILAER